MEEKQYFVESRNITQQKERRSWDEHAFKRGARVLRIECKTRQNGMREFVVKLLRTQLEVPKGRTHKRREEAGSLNRGTEREPISPSINSDDFTVPH